MEKQAKDGTFYQQIGPDEWKPVTREAKDGTLFAKVGEDEWRPLATPKTPTSGESAARGAFQGATFGLIDEAAGGLEAAGQLIGVKGAGGSFNEMGFTTPNANIGENYRQARDKRRMLDERARAANPETYTAGEFLGGLATAAVPGMGAANSIKGMAGVGAKAGALAGFGGSDTDLTDPDFENVGRAAVDTFAGSLMGAGVGAGVGLAFKGVQKGYGAAKNAYSRFRGRQAATVNQAQSASTNATAKSGGSAEISGGGVEIEQGGKILEFKAPKTLKELRDWKPQSGTGEVLGKRRLQEIERTVPDLQTKPLKYHYAMMENPKAMKELKLRYENLPTKDAQRIATYNQEIVNESAQKIRQTTEDLVGSEPRNMTDAGNDFIAAVKARYNAEKEALGPVFGQIQHGSQDLNQTAAQDLIVMLGENTKAGRLLSQSPETGYFSLAKNTPRSGLSDSEHGILARVIEDLNDGMTFKEIQDTREFLRKAVDPKNPSASSEINKVRSILLSYLEDMAGKMGDKVGGAFRGWAKNERGREALEQIIGGKVDTLDAMFAANPERVVQKIFSNPNYTKVAAEYVGPQKIREMVGSYIQIGIDKATDSARGFSPEKFRSWLKSNQSFLRNNVEPEIADRLSALADYGYYGKRFLDEVNPSGTAASLKEMIDPGSFVQKVKQQGVRGAVRNEVASFVDTKLKQRSAIKTVNEMLGEVSEPRTGEFGRRVFGRNESEALGRANRVQRSAIPALPNATTGGSSRVAQDENESRPLKGREKWANDGFEKLLKHGGATQRLQSLKGALLSSPKGKRLLIAASNRKPGTKAFEMIVTQIEKEFGGEQ